MPNKPRKTLKEKQREKSRRHPAFYGLAVAAALSLAVIASAGWLVYTSFYEDDEPAARACTVSDEDLCKFFAVMGARSSFKATVTATSPKGKITTIKYYVEGEKRSRYQVKDGKTTFEYIIIDKIIYMLAADGTWWKQALSPDKLEEYSLGYDFRFETPDPAADNAEKVAYKMYSTEWYAYPYQLKYQVDDARYPGATSYIWFDMEDHLLRRYSRESPEGKVDVAFTYENVSITEPENVKVLGPNQYILPGKSKPETAAPKP